MAFFGNFKKSALELKNVRCLIVTAMLIALDLVLKTFVNVQITDELKLSFAFVAVAAIGMLYGPVVAGLACVITDVLGFLMKPTGGFSPLFTLVEVVGGVLYGVFLYRMNPVKPDMSGFGAFIKSIGSNWGTAVRIIAAKLSVAVVCNLIMTPLFITITVSAAGGELNASAFWSGFVTRVAARVVKNAVEVPVHSIILLLILPAVWAAYYAVFKRHQKVQP